MAGILTFEMGYTPQENTAHGKKTTGLTITAFLYNSKKEGAYLDSYLDKTFSNIGQTLMAVKPFTWEANNEAMKLVCEEIAGLEVDADVAGYYELSDGKYVLTGDTTAVADKTYYQYLGKKIQIPAVVFNVFNASTGIAYGDITYLEGGETEVFFEDWNDDMFGGEKTFVAYGFVLGNGNPINVLALGDLN